jgi:hypothetical protein
MEIHLLYLQEMLQRFPSPATTSLPSPPEAEVVLFCRITAAWSAQSSIFEQLL